MRRVRTYQHYKGKLFVAAQIQRRRTLVWKRTCSGIALTVEQIERRYVESIRAAKDYARIMRSKLGEYIDIEDYE